jgi:putative peptidoglycan lipid II flippase
VNEPAQISHETRMSTSSSTPKGSRPAGNALLVGIGILASRVVGFLRQRTLNHYFGGHSDAADAFYAAFKIPNLLQNLFGEGALSGSFIPVYARLIEGGDEDQASAVANTVLSLLTLITSLLVLVGILFAPFLIDYIAPGFDGEKRLLTIELVRVLFPGAGILVISAWCLGVLNCHRKFLLSYSAPVLWNVCIIIAVVVGAQAEEPHLLAHYTAWGAVIGGVAQVVIQVPSILKVHLHLRPQLQWKNIHVRTVLKNFIPTAAVRGVAQVSAYIDQIIASLLPTGAITGLTNAQLIYTLPVSLFGMSISAAALPELSRLGDGSGEIINQRLEQNLRYLRFSIIPSVVGFLLLGDVIVGGVYQTGAFSRSDVVYVWAILCGSSIGLIAGTTGRLFASTFYALKDPRTPLACALMRVLIATAAGYYASIFGPGLLGLSSHWGVVGLTAASGCAGWLECWLLEWALRKRLAVVIRIESRFLFILWFSALVSGGVCYLAKPVVTGVFHPFIAAAVLLPGFVGLFLLMTYAAGVPECSENLQRILRRIQRIRNQ